MSTTYDGVPAASSPLVPTASQVQDPSTHPLFATAREIRLALREGFKPVLAREDATLSAALNDDPNAMRLALAMALGVELLEQARTLKADVGSIITAAFNMLGMTPTEEDVIH